MRRALTLSTLLLIAGASVADAAPPFGNYGHRRGPWRRLAAQTGSGGPSPLTPNPNSCKIIPIYGQSSSVGFCDSGGSAPYSCVVVNTAPLSGGAMPCWSGDPELADGYSTSLGGLVALDQDGSCRRFLAEQPAYNMVRKYREMSGETATTFTYWAGNPGHSISELTDDLDTNWPRFVDGLDYIISEFAATADPQATYGCTELDWIALGMIQGESDDGSPGTNNNYTAEVLTFVDKIQTLHDSRFPTKAARDVIILWDQPSNWSAQADRRAAVNQQLLAADDARTFLDVFQTKGQANPDLIATTGTECDLTTQAISFEYGVAPDSGSTLHWSPCWQIWHGENFGKWVYLKYYQQGVEPGFRITSATLSGTDLTVTWNVPYPPMILDAVGDTGPCPDHWNSNQGFELLNIASPGYFDAPELIAPPTITSIGAITGGNSITFGLSHPPYLDDGKFATRFEVAYRGIERAANEPEHGCRDFDDILSQAGETNDGAPWTSYYDTDPERREAGDAALFGTSTWEYASWMLSESFEITQGTAVPADTAPQYVVSGGTDYISCPDEATDVFDGATRMVIAFRVRTDSAAADNDESMRKWATMRLVYDRLVGTGVRFSINIGGAANFSTPVATDALPEDSPVFQSVIISYDGNLTSGERIRHIYDGVDLPDTEANIPTSMINTSNVLQLMGNRLSNSTTGVEYKDWAIWMPTQAVTDTELMSIVHGDEPDLENLSVGGVTPVYFIRPSCGDDLTTTDGVTNLGTGASATCTGVNYTAGDLVADGTPVCP